MATIKEMLTANTADILEATELLKVLGDREGQFVWKQLTAENGDFIAFVTADNENSYPNGGTQDGYWYELVEEGVSGIDTGVVTLTARTSTLTIAHNLKEVPSKAMIIADGIIAHTSGNTIEILSTEEITRNQNNASLAEGLYADGYGNFKRINGVYITLNADNIVASFSTAPFGTGTYRWIVMV